MFEEPGIYEVNVNWLDKERLLAPYKQKIRYYRGQMWLWCLVSIALAVLLLVQA